MVSAWPGPVRWSWAATRDADGEWRLEHFGARAPASVEVIRWRYSDAALAVESLSPRAAARRLGAGTVAVASALGTPLAFGPTPSNGVFEPALALSLDKPWVVFGRCTPGSVVLARRCGPSSQRRVGAGATLRQLSRHPRPGSSG